MNSSINEITATARKAAKGAGFSWSMADEVAFAVSWLCRQGMDGTEALAAHLAIIDNHGADNMKLTSLNTPWRGGEHGLCSVSSGAALSDLANELANKSPSISGELLEVISPVLLIPFVAYASHQITKHGASVTNAAPELTCHAQITCNLFSARVVANSHTSWLHEVHLASTDTSSPVNIAYQINKVNPREMDVQPPAIQHRVDVKPETLDKLNHYAARTYAPATDASRDGAGAGTSDND